MKTKGVFKKFSKEIDDKLSKRYINYKEYEYARNCAIDLGYGISPTEVYINNMKGLSPQRCSEIFTFVMDNIKVLVKY